MAKVFTVINRKGGQGKTTIATSLAAKIAKQLESDEKRILLIDLDPQGHAAKALGIDDGGRCIGDLLLGTKSIRDVIVSADRSKSGRGQEANGQGAQSAQSLGLGERDGKLFTCFPPLADVDLHFTYLCLHRVRVGVGFDSQPDIVQLGATD